MISMLGPMIIYISVENTIARNVTPLNSVREVFFNVAYSEENRISRSSGCKLCIFLVLYGLKLFVQNLHASWFRNPLKFFSFKTYLNIVRLKPKRHLHLLPSKVLNIVLACQIILSCHQFSETFGNLKIYRNTYCKTCHTSLLWWMPSF